MKHTLLIADDEKPVHYILKKLLRPDDYNILSVFDGAEVAETARRENPDVILLDLQMPNKNGKQILLELRGDDKTRAIPVLILTGNRGAQLLGEAEALGLDAEDYIDKPFNIDALRARIESILRRGERSVAATHPLTRLPGSPAIEREVLRRIGEGRHFALIYVDIDGLRGYNDAKGQDLGDQALRDLADTLRDALKAVGHEQGFLGHIAEDDFIVLTDPGFEEKIAHYIMESFKKRIPELTLSIASTSTEVHDFKRTSKLMDIVKKFKEFLKDRQDRKESVYIKDRARPQKS